MAEAARKALRLPAPRTKAKPLPAGVQVEEADMPRFVTPNRNFYRIDTALSVPQIDPGQWSLRVHGMVEKEFTMNFDELLDQELVETYLTLTCVSNPVGGDLAGNAQWLGYPLRHGWNAPFPKPAQIWCSPRRMTASVLQTRWKS